MNDDQQPATEINEKLFVIQVIFLVATFTYQVIPIIVFIKHRDTKPISLRSPILTLFMIIGLIFINLLYFIYEIFKTRKLQEFALYDGFCNYFVRYYLEFYLILFISYSLRIHRVYQIFKTKYNNLNLNLNKNKNNTNNEDYNNMLNIDNIKSNNIIPLNLFNINNNNNLTNNNFQQNNPNSYLESTYLKIYFVVIFSAILIRMALKIFSFDQFMIPLNFKECDAFENYKEFQTTLFWVILDFVDSLILITLFKYILMIELKHMLKLEICLFVFIWLSNQVFMRLIQFYNIYFNGNTLVISETYIKYICIIIINITTFVIAYIPIWSLNIYFKNKSKKKVNEIMSKNNNTGYTSRSYGSLLTVNFEYYDEMKAFLKDNIDINNNTNNNINNNNNSDFLVNLLDFYRDVTNIDNNASKVDMLDMYQTIFDKYFNKLSRYYIKFNNDINKNCLENYEKMQNDIFKVDVFAEAIEFANYELGKVKFPYFGELITSKTKRKLFGGSIITTRNRSKTTNSKGSEIN